MYTAAVTTGAASAKQAHALIELLTAAGQRKQRERAGFIGAPK